MEAADLENRRLVRRLARAIAAEEVIGSHRELDLVDKLHPLLEDTAHSVLLGLHPEASPSYVSPDRREAVAAAGIAEAAQQLRMDGYPGLACDLDSAAHRLKSYGSIQLLGSLTEAETGSTPQLPLTEHTQLLCLLLSLAGSSPSIRHHRFTFQKDASTGSTAADSTQQQLEWDACPSAATPPPVAAAPLSTRVFTEAPDPYCLTDSSSAAAVRLPDELGWPTEAFAGSQDVRELGAGMDSRPVWGPTAAASLLPPRSASWLPIPASLLEMQRDSRRDAPLRPLGLPLSLLGMSDPPGTSTMFSQEAAVAAAWEEGSDGGDAASADSVQPQGSSFAVAAADAGRDGLGGSGEAAVWQQAGQLWSLAEAELAQQALLALHGVSSSLLQLQAMLAMPDTLPRRSIAGLLQSVVVAAELRQRLHEFVAALSGTSGSGSGSGSTHDPVQQSFATAVAQVLQRQSAALQQLEQQQSRSWQELSASGTGAMPGQRLHSRSPTLLQVSLHTRRLQLQLHGLADLCWCCTASQGCGSDGDPEGGTGLAAAQAQQLETRWLWQDGFPGGTALLDYLYRRTNGADNTDAPLLRFLFAQAMQPYLRHMHLWAFSSHPVSGEFGTSGDKELLTLDFLPPDERQDGTMVPVDPPTFLQPLHAAFMRSGSQLRMLHSLELHGRRLACQLADLGEHEAALQRQQDDGLSRNTRPTGATGTAAGSAAAAGASVQGELHTSLSASDLPGGFAQSASIGLQLAEQRDPWISLAGSSALASSESQSSLADGTLDFEMGGGGLRQAVRISQQQDSARTAAVDSWLSSLALQRRLGEHAAVNEQLGRVAVQREQAADRAMRHAAALSRQHSSKVALMQEQQAAAADRRAWRAAEQAQQEAQDRQLQAHIAIRQHSAAVAELEQALSRATLPGTRELPAQKLAAGDVSNHLLGSREEGVGLEKVQPVAEAADTAVAPSLDDVPATAAAATAAVAPHLLAPAGLPSVKTRSRQQRFQLDQQQQQQQRGPEPLSMQAAGAQGFSAAARNGGGQSMRQPWLPGAAPDPLQPYPTSALLHHQLSLGGEAARQGQGEEEQSADGAVTDVAAPLAAVLEASVSHSVLSQYRSTSRACVRLFLDELKVLEHLEALRRFFFQARGDWAEALVQRLSAHADSLLPLASHQADSMLEDALRGSSVEGDPYAAHLRIKMLPGGTSAIQAQAGAIHVGTPQRRARSFWSSQHTVTLAPTQLDALDCVTLGYEVGWPLSAVITEDTLQGYAAVFSVMVRLRRVEQLLRGLAAPLAAQAKSSADLLLSEEDADKAHRRIQVLRAFRFGAAQFVAAIQAFLQSRATGDAWVHLLAKLMVSSDEVAATLISRQPSAPMTGLLSRMNSLGPMGKAAHKLAQHMSRALSGSAPASPSAAAAAAASGGGGGQLSRFNSLLAGSAAGSRPHSAANTPRGTAAAPAAAAAAAGSKVAAAAAGGKPPQLSRFAWERPVGVSGPFAGSSSRAAQQASAASSPTAAATGNLSAQTSLTSVLLGQAAAEVAQASAAAGSELPEPDAASWAEQVQRSQQGICDLQELLDLHRSYVRQASEDCLTFGGSKAVREAVEGCLQSLVAFAIRLQGAVRSGCGRRLEDSWTQALRLDATWLPLAAGIADFERRAQQLQELLRDVSGNSVLAELQLDFNGWHARAAATARRRHELRQVAEGRRA